MWIGHASRCGRARTLAEQWEGLGEGARLLLRVAGQLPVAATVPLGRLGLLAGLRDEGTNFFNSPLADAATELIAVSLLEDLRGDLVKLTRWYASMQRNKHRQQSALHFGAPAPKG